MATPEPPNSGHKSGHIPGHGSGHLTGHKFSEQLRFMARHIQKRSDGGYRFRLRIPSDIEAMTGQSMIRLSLHTRDEAVAIQKARTMKQGFLRHWDALRYGSSGDARREYEAAVKIARRHGLAYKTSDEIADSPVQEILQRASALSNPSIRKTDAKAVLGAVKRAQPCVSHLLKEVETLRQTDLAHKTEHQIHSWRIARQRAIKNFLQVVGDREINDISRDDALDFRDWWAQRMLDEGLSASSPNKDLQHLSSMLNLVGDAMRLETGNPFGGLRFTVRGEAKAHAITPDEIRTAFAEIGRLNVEARAIVEIMAQTGARPSEICNLDQAMIRLADNIPHISIEPREDRELKTVNAKRRIPLVGRALETARGWPEGFDRYRDKEASLSAAVGKWMRGIFPDDKVSAYSFRHGFQDRLIAEEIPERTQAELMGHAIQRERYGAGTSLDALADVMERIAVR